MNSLKKSFLFVTVKTAAAIVLALPAGVSLWIARGLGRCASVFMVKKRKVAYANLKTVFAVDHSPSQINRMTRQVFINFIQSVMEVVLMPKIKRLGVEKFVEYRDWEYVRQASAQGKGLILLAIHSGSWELASMAGATANDGPYHVVANDQSRFPQLGRLLNQYRTEGGAHVIATGTATKDIIKGVQANEVISLVLDQGGKEGVEIPFLGKSASMSTGAVRMALKYGCGLCPVWIERRKGGRHLLTAYPSITMDVTGDTEADIAANVFKAAAHFERLIRENPCEYNWFYKVFKYSTQMRILILDDGRTGHLRQSQAVAASLTEVLHKKGKTALQYTASVQWRGQWVEPFFHNFMLLVQDIGWINHEQYLKYFLTQESFNDVMKYKADYVISCGWMASGANFLVAQSHLAKSIAILTPIISPERFDVVIQPEHDSPKPLRRAQLIVPKVSPNLVNRSYLKQQTEGLMRTYSHLKNSVRTKFGLLIGGNAKGVTFDEGRMRQLVDQLKESALHYNADILVTTSRRTPEAIEQIVLKELKNFERCSLCIIANQRNLPEAVGGILGLSDLLVVSGESISMVSEALSSGKGTIVFSPNGRYGQTPKDKYEEFVLKLNEQGYLMVTTVDDLKSKISHLLSRKISLNAIDDQEAIETGLSRIV